MPKLNAVLMVALAVAVIAATGFLVLRSPAAPDDVLARAKACIRKLADTDADLRREGEEGLRRLGIGAVAPLRDAARSTDRALAGRAAKLLEELVPDLGSHEREASKAPSETLDFTFVSSGVPDNPSRSGLYLVEVANRSQAPVVLTLPASDSGWHPGWFEVEDDRGQVERTPAISFSQPEKESLAILGPGESRMLFRGGPHLESALLRPQSRSVRFVYDAASAEYRERAGGSGAGNLLPAGKHASKSLPPAEAR